MDFLSWDNDDDVGYNDEDFAKDSLQIEDDVIEGFEESERSDLSIDVQSWMQIGGLSEDLAENDVATFLENNASREAVAEQEFISMHTANSPRTKKLRPFEQYVADLCSGRKKLGDMT